MSWKFLVVAGLATCLMLESASAGFTLFHIRNGNPGGTGAAPVTSSDGLGGYSIAITTGGQKVGLGSSDMDGKKLKSIDRLSITRSDTYTGPSAGAAVAPYLNFWITDGTNFAVVANEPSNAAFQPLFNNGYDLSFSDLADKTAKIFENDNTAWLPNGGVGLTFADLADFTVQAPTASQLGTGWAGLGTGAPRELVTNQAYGVNWVFGDTLNNYVPGVSGAYSVSNPSVSTVPEPSSMLIACCGLFAAGVHTRRRKRASVAV
ncbi:PEP-CTERM sorting domain-containing protein [Roseimaritima ulvae]|nr:PEP-CTERM sorting domain-containing protein [Roseimaritima ulvae]